MFNPGVPGPRTLMKVKREQTIRLVINLMLQNYERGNICVLLSSTFFFHFSKIKIYFDFESYHYGLRPFLINM
jgi:hypothetical protein